MNANNELVVNTRKTPAKAAASTKKTKPVAATNSNDKNVPEEEEPTTKATTTRAARSRNTPVKQAREEPEEHAMDVEGPVPLGDGTPLDEQPDGSEPARDLQAKTPSRLQAAKASKKPPAKKKRPNPIRMR